MKKIFLVVLAVLVLSITTAGSLYPHGWQTNTAVVENDPVVGGSYLVVRDGAGIEFNGSCIVAWFTGSAEYCGDFYLTEEVPGACTNKYPVLAPWGGGLNHEMSIYLGWLDPDWEDGFNICLEEELPVPWP